MLQAKESRVSAYHNYLINGMLIPGMLIGGEKGGNGFYLLFDFVSPGGRMPLVNATIYGPQKDILARIKENELIENPGACSLHFRKGDFALSGPDNKAILVAKTHEFTNGYLTTINARLYDENGILRVEPLDNSIQVHGKANTALTRSISLHT